MRHLRLVASFLTIAFPALLIIGTAVGEIAMSSIAVLFLLHCCAEKDWGWTKQRWVRILAVLWLYLIVRSLFALQPWEALRRGLPFVRYFMFAAALAYWVLQDSVTRQRFFRMLAGTILFFACDGLLQWAIGKDILLHDVMFQPDGNLRLTGPFLRPILGNMLTWLSFPVILRLIANEDKRQRTMGMALALLSVAVIALSGERMPLLLTLLGWSLVMVMTPFVRRTTLVTAITCMSLIVVLAFFNPMLKHRQVDSTISTFAHWSDSPYGHLLNSGLRVGAMNPVFGVGSNHFRILCPTLYDAQTLAHTEVCNIHPHNIYMEWWVENGLVGLGLFIAFLVAVGQQVFRVWTVQRTNPLFLGFLIAVILRVWPLATTTSFFSRWGGAPFWLVLGCLLVYTVNIPRSRPDAD